MDNPAAFTLTPGQASDLGQAEPLIEGVDTGALLADKAYAADGLVDTLIQRRITPVIAPKINRTTKRDCDFALYRERNLVKHFFNNIKHYLAISTRYDKLARNFLTAAQLVAAISLLN
jgi:transposase